MKLPAIDLAFPVYGQTIRAEHGYSLYNSLADIIPGLRDTHDRYWKQAGIMPITGRPLGKQRIALGESGRLILRIDCKLVKHVLPLAGARLLIRNDAVLLGEPVSHELKPVSDLLSPLVVFKGVTEPERFLSAVAAALRDLRVKGCLLPLQKRDGVSDGSRPISKGRTSAPRNSVVAPSQRHGEIVGYQERIGFGLEIRGLSPAESLRVQEVGIGGYRKFGCGILVAPRHPPYAAEPTALVVKHKEDACKAVGFGSPCRTARSCKP